MNNIGLIAAFLGERKKTFIKSGSCEALRGECRFLHPYNAEEFWTQPIPTKECSSFGCAYWESLPEEIEDDPQVTTKRNVPRPIVGR